MIVLLRTSIPYLLLPASWGVMLQNECFSLFTVEKVMDTREFRGGNTDVNIMKEVWEDLKCIKGTRSTRRSGRRWEGRKHCRPEATVWAAATAESTRWCGSWWRRAHLCILWKSCSVLPPSFSLASPVSHWQWQKLEEQRVRALLLYLWSGWEFLAILTLQ